METSKGAIVNDVAKVLNDAADLIEQRGWSKDEPRGPDGECCPVRAMGLASGYKPPFFEAVEAFGVHVGSYDLAAWNRAQPGPEPVIAALRGAARSVEQP
jgi:hypothetical protein